MKMSSFGLWSRLFAPSFGLFLPFVLPHNSPFCLWTLYHPPSLFCSLWEVAQREYKCHRAYRTHSHKDTSQVFWNSLSLQSAFTRCLNVDFISPHYFYIYFNYLFIYFLAGTHSLLSLSNWLNGSFLPCPKAQANMHAHTHTLALLPPPAWKRFVFPGGHSDSRLALHKEVGGKKKGGGKLRSYKTGTRGRLSARSAGD